MESIDSAIERYVPERNQENLRNLDRSLVGNNIYVPISSDVIELSEGKYDVSVVCIRTDSGQGAIPAFTTMETLLLWKPGGTKYTMIKGDALIRIALNLGNIEQIRINPAGGPRGVIPQSEFQRLLELR